MAAGLTALLVFGLLPVAILAAIISAIVEARRQAAAEDAAGDVAYDAGIGTVRRLFIYTLALVGMIFAAVGVGMVIAGALDAGTGRTLLAERRQGLAVALALSVVGTPAWLLFAWLAQRSVHDHDVERRSQVRRLYLGLARGVALVVVAANAVTAGRMIAGIETFRGDPWGALIVWIAVWYVHERLARAEPPPTVVTRLLDRFAGYFGVLLGLTLLLGGATGVLTAPLSEAYDRAFRESLVNADWTEPLRAALVVLLVGAVLWGWYWLRDLAQRDRRTTLWRVHVFLFGALLGVVLTIVPAALVVYATLEWFFGQPAADAAAAHFANTPALLGTLVIGIATWGYHRAVLSEAGAGREHSSPERVYRYLLTAAGLATAAIAIATLIALAADALGGPRTEFVRAAGWWRNPLMRAITLLAVGAPLWLRYWAETQRVVANSADERGAPSRRIVVFSAVGIAIFAGLVGLTILLYQVFRAALNAELGLALLRDARWTIAVAATASIVAVYHVLVLREDQAARPAEAPVMPSTRREVVVVATALPHDLLTELQRVAGGHVRLWRRLDVAEEPALAASQRAALLAAVAAATADQLLIIVRDDVFELIPFTRDAN